MTEKIQPAAFLSYAHFEDQEDAWISQWCNEVQRETRKLIGRAEFTIFLDCKSIEWGQRLSQRIDEGVSSSALLIPFLTPDYFNSLWCYKEFIRFMAYLKERNLKATERILPVLLIRCDEFDNPDLCTPPEWATRLDDILTEDWAKDLERISCRQWAQELKDTKFLEWTTLRQKDFDLVKVRKEVNAVAGRIKDLLRTPFKQLANEPIQDVQSGISVTTQPSLYPSLQQEGSNRELGAEQDTAIVQVDSTPRTQEQTTLSAIAPKESEKETRAADTVEGDTFVSIGLVAELVKSIYENVGGKQDRLLENLNASALIFYTRGNAYYENGNLVLAAHLYEAAIHLNDKFTEAWYNWGLTLYSQAANSAEKNSMFRKSCEKYEKASALDPDNPIIYNNLGDAHYRLQEFEAAILCYDKALKLNSMYLKAFYNRGLAYACLQKYREAILDFSQVIALNPEFAEAYHIRGLAYDYLAADANATSTLNTACDDYRRALILNPGFSECRHHLAGALARLSQMLDHPISEVVEADRLFSQLTKADPPPDVQIIDIWIDWGNLLLSAAEKCKNREDGIAMLHRAVDVYRVATSLSPDSLSAWINLANALSRLSSKLSQRHQDYCYAEAAKACKKAVDLQPSDPRLWGAYSYFLATQSTDFALDLESRKRLANESLVWSERALREDANSIEPSFLASVFFNTATFQEVARDAYVKARHIYENQILTSPDPVPDERRYYSYILFTLARLTPEQNEALLLLDRVICELDKVLTTSSNDPAVHHLYGEALEHLAGRNSRGAPTYYREAAEEFAKAASSKYDWDEDSREESQMRSLICSYLCDNNKDTLARAEEIFQRLLQVRNYNYYLSLAKVKQLTNDNNAALGLVNEALAGHWTLPEIVRNDAILKSLSI